MSQIHHTNRDYALDILRGICVISIVLIHTTFWSGGSYVPQAVQSLSLLIDVPAFFFIAGMALAYSKAPNPLPALWKLIFYFGVCIAIYDLCVSIDTKHISFMNTAAAITLHGFSTNALPVLGGSYWFVPVFCVAMIAGALIISFVRVPLALLASFALGLYIAAFFGIFSWQGSFLGVGLQYLVFYTALIVLGYYFIRSQRQRLIIILLASVGVGGFAMLVVLHSSGSLAHLPSIFDLQAHKFPVSLPYVLASCASLAGLLVVYMQLAKRGGRLSKDSACGLESWISSPRELDRPQVLSPTRALKSHDSSSTILESKSSSESHKSFREKAESNAQNPEFSSTILESCANSKNHKSLRKQIAPDNNLDSKQMQSVRAYACGLKIACRDCGLSFLRFAGVNAIYFYIAQGISSSLLFPILRYFPEMSQIHWSVKLACAFGVNLALCVVFVWVLMAVFAGIGIVGRNMKQVL